MEKLSLESVENKHAAGKAQTQIMSMILKVMEKDKIPQEVIPEESINNDTVLSLAGQVSSIKDEVKVKYIIDTILLSCTIPELMELQEELNYNIGKALYYTAPTENE
jgi:hypothetical protein